MIASLDRWLGGLGGGGRRMVLVLVALALFLPGFFSLPPLDRDEPRFAQASRQMLQTGDFIDIRFQDEARHKKPAGIYWLQVAAVAATGMETPPIWAYRLPSLLAALAAVLLTARIAADLAGARAGLVAGLLFAGVFSLGMEARLAKTDAVLLLTVLVAQWAVLRVWQAARPAAQGPGSVAVQPGAGSGGGLVVFLAFWGAIALGILVKGPVGTMVVALTLAALAAGMRRAGWMLALRPLPGLAVAALLVLPWYLAITFRSDGAFWEASLGADMLAKVQSGQENHGAPPGAYLVLLWLTFFPASVALALALPALWRARREAAMIFAAAWVLPAWLVFEATPTKLTHYVLPLYPALAIAVAVVWDRVVAAPRRRWQWLAAGGAGLLAAAFLLALAIYAATLGPAPWPVLAVALAVLGGGMALAIRALALRLPLAAASGLALAGLGMTGGGVLLVAQVDAIWPAPRIVAAAVTLGCPAPVIRTDGYHEASLVFLSPGPVRRLDGEDPVAALAEPCARALLPEARSAAMAAAGAVPLARIGGLNLGNGRPLDLTLWARP